jgi:hypothetical protein
VREQVGKRKDRCVEPCLIQTVHPPCVNIVIICYSIIKKMKEESLERYFRIISKFSLILYLYLLIMKCNNFT